MIMIMINLHFDRICIAKRATRLFMRQLIILCDVDSQTDILSFRTNTLPIMIIILINPPHMDSQFV